MYTNCRYRMGSSRNFCATDLGGPLSFLPSALGPVGAVGGRSTAPPATIKRYASASHSATSKSSVPP